MAIRNNISDTFRSRSGGKVSIPTNSKPYDDSYHLDRSRLGVHQEWDPDAKNEWGGTGKMVEKPNDIRLNAIGAMGDIRAKSSNRQADSETNPDTGSGPCCAPTLYPPNRTNPMFRKRG